MRASEILRNLADLIDGAESGTDTTAAPKQSPKLTAVNVDNTDRTEQGGTFVPPLQAKIELLKKSVDVDNIYDQGGPDEELSGHGDDSHDELDQIKQLSGIKVVATDEAASDEPLDV